MASYLGYDEVNATSATTVSSIDLNQERIAEINRLNEVSNDIRNSYIWVVFALGFPGNIFSILTVLTMQTMTPATFYVALLAMCDGCTLTLKLIGHQLSVNHIYLGHIGCKMLFLPGFLSTLANWVLVLICAERFVSVCFPLKKVFIFTMRRSYMSAGILAGILFLIFTILFCVMRASDPSGLYCGTYNEYLQFWTQGWYWINATIYLFAPFPCIVVLTALIIRGLARSRRDRRGILRNGSTKQENNQRLLEESERLERTITIMLILAALIFLLLALPACVFLLAYRGSNDPLVEAKWLLFEQIQFVFIDSSHAVNFFLYFFTAKRFRHQFFCLLTCKVWPRRRRRSYYQSACMTRNTLARSHDDVSHL